MKPYTIADAETDLRAALHSGHLDRIDTAAAAVDRLDHKPHAAVNLHAAALWYAEQGLRVFPLQPGRKIPFKGSNGCHDASSNRDVVNGWWESTPDANIGIATGHLVDVVDIDGVAGQQSRAAHWDDIFSAIDVDAVAKVLSPRPGGMHLYVPCTGDGNSAGIVPGVDYRGRGGYVLAPPSVIAPGGKDTPGSYRFLGTPVLAALAKGAAA